MAANEGITPPGCIERIVPHQNYGYDGKTKIGLSVHHIDGSIAAAEGRFMDPSQQASAHYGIAFDGGTRLWVPTNFVAYAQCSGNWEGWITAELESVYGEENGLATPAQVDAVGRLMAFHQLPAFPAITPLGGGLGYHRQFGGVCAVHWGQTSCPGDGIVMQIPRMCMAVTGDTSTPDPIKKRKVNRAMWIAYVLALNWCDVWYNGVIVDGFLNNDHPNQFNVGQKWQGYMDQGAGFTVFKTESEYAPVRDRLAISADLKKGPGE